jgi:hypothetical protein
MKKIIFSLTLLLFVLTSFEQTPVISKDYYLKKSKTQKTVGWILLGTGAGIAAYGFITRNSYTDNAGPFGGQNYTGALIAIGGGVISASSIPFFISSAKNKRKAATISFKNQKILFPRQNTFVLKTQPTLTLKIEL